MYTLHETILSYFKLSGNSKMTGYAQMREAADLSWYKLFKKTKESTVRKWVKVENGIAEIPCSLENLLGVYVLDSCDNLAPLFEDNFKNTLVKPTLKCACTSCDTECLCPTVQDSIVQDDVVISGEVYSNKTITRLLKSGEIVEYKSTWTPSYDAQGVINDVIQVESQKIKCTVDIKPCGCTISSEENTTKLLGCGCITDECAPSMRDRYPALHNEHGYYKYDYQTKKLHIFNALGKKSKLKQVVLVFQSNGTDMLIPDYARPALIALFNWTKIMYAPGYNFDEREAAKRNFNREKTEMMRYLHPIPFEWITEAENPVQMSKRRTVVHEEETAPSCTPVAAATSSSSGGTTTIINNYTTIIGGDSNFEFIIPEDDWTTVTLTELRCHRITNIYVDGIKRKVTIVAESDVTTPADNSFYWKIASGRLIYAPGLMKDAWVEITYKKEDNCTPV